MEVQQSALLWWAHFHGTNVRLRSIDSWQKDSWYIESVTRNLTWADKRCCWNKADFLCCWEGKICVGWIKSSLDRSLNALGRGWSQSNVVLCTGMRKRCQIQSASAGTWFHIIYHVFFLVVEKSHLMLGIKKHKSVFNMAPFVITPMYSTNTTTSGQPTTFCWSVIRYSAAAWSPISHCQSVIIPSRTKL